MTKAEYDAQKAAANQTIQHTVANVTDVLPERVIDIVVEEEEEEEEEGGRARYFGVAAARSVRLKYKITVYDPTITVEKLRAGLVQATRNGKMDAGLRYYSAQFGTASLTRGSTFGEPQVTSAAVQRDASERLTGVEVALVVIGVTVGLTLMVVFLLLRCYWEEPQSPPVRVRSENLNQIV